MTREYVRRKRLAIRRPGDWDALLDRAAAIVEASPVPLGLRAVHYRLVSDPAAGYENLSTEYDQLSKRTAEARRRGRFPRLVDATRSIDRRLSWDGPQDAHEWLVEHYRRDRTEGQSVALYLVVEKAALRGALWAWFADLGIPIVALRGYSSQGHLDQLLDDVTAQLAEQHGDQQRRGIALLASDHDGHGRQIAADFQRRAWFLETHRIALTAAQVDRFDLPKAPGKDGGVQVELDALMARDDGADLRGLYQQAIDRWWDPDAYQAALAQEETDRAELAERWDDQDERQA